MGTFHDIIFSADFAADARSLAALKNSKDERSAGKAAVRRVIEPSLL
jgi:hypothetical protein